jgi:hypothetical protein
MALGDSPGIFTSLHRFWAYGSRKKPPLRRQARERVGVEEISADTLANYEDGVPHPTSVAPRVRPCQHMVVGFHMLVAWRRKLNLPLRLRAFLSLEVEGGTTRG